jgi:hypothetical protein
MNERMRVRKKVGEEEILWGERNLIKIIKMEEAIKGGDESKGGSE